MLCFFCCINFLLKRFNFLFVWSFQSENVIVLDPAITQALKSKLDLFLYENCISIPGQKELLVLFLSRSAHKVTQKQLTFSYDGTFSLEVHCKPYSVDSIIKKVPPSTALSLETIPSFVDRAVQVINLVREFEICAGVDNSEYKEVWPLCSNSGVIDTNPYKECRYSETFRSKKCEILVSRRKRRCAECSKTVGILGRRLTMVKKDVVHPNTPNIFLSEPQKLQKLEEQRKEIHNAKRTIERMKIRRLIEKEGVCVDKTVSADLQSILESLDVDKLIEEGQITPQQALFLEQQLGALSAKSPRARRWHPTMIRFALSIFHKSPAAYGAIYESGLLTLPCRRTLFDYTHFKPVKDGIHYEVLESVAKKLENMELYQRYHVLMADEIYISKNLVYESSTGKLIGYTSMGDVEKELSALDAFLKDPEAAPARPPLASKLLTFLIKGVSSSVKEVIATYAVDTLTKEQLYRWSWDVIGKCERSGVAIIAYTTDGSSVNRAFIKMNKPYSIDSNVVYDTLNKCAPRSVINKEKNHVRVLYFIADTPHLLKTIRNCFATSSNKRYLNKRTGKMMLRRRLAKNGQKILWASIVRLYHHQKDKTLRLAYKLNAQNVFLNGYSKMKVKYAAEVLSETVAQLLENLKWENLEETINFIRKVNAFFDMLNGAHSKQGKRKRNPNLAPYCSKEDQRFDKLDEFLQYLQEWKEDAEASVKANKTVDESVQADDPNDVVEPDQWEDIENEEEQDPASVRQLSHQTLEGIKITVHGFTGAVKFLLDEGVKFINARVFCQDPLEQYFSKLRSRCGGSTNPNMSQALHSQRSIHVQGTLGVKKNYRGNTEVNNQCMTISTEPLPKRRKLSSKPSASSS